jgi:1,4-dihydroxy-2-naphthoate octaprenyltransferase
VKNDLPIARQMIDAAGLAPGRQPRRLRVLLLLAHPRRESLCGALADAYAVGARAAGVELRRFDLAALRFDPNVVRVSPRDQDREDGLRLAMETIVWADHIVIIFPTWWGTMPAVLKGFLDRVLIPGFAFADRDEGEGWEKLLSGRSAHLLTTMDLPLDLSISRTQRTCASHPRLLRHFTGSTHNFRSG